MNADLRIVADAQDRMQALIKHIRKTGTDTPYPAVLLITSWTDESREEVIGRVSRTSKMAMIDLSKLMDQLDIANEVECFDKCAAVSLQDAASLDQRFATTMGQLLNDLASKHQLSIPFERASCLIIALTSQVSYQRSCHNGFDCSQSLAPGCASTLQVRAFPC